MEESIFLELPARNEYLVWTETVLLSVINVAAFSGNFSVCYAVYRNQRLRSLPNMFVVALAVSDILICICNMPFSVAFLFHGRWIFGANFCLFHGFTFFTFSMTSLHIMGLIAVSRYFCIVKREKYVVLFNKRRILVYIAAVCCVALAGSVPPLFFTKGGYRLKPGQAVCMYAFETSIAYTIFAECVYIATPLSVITFCYIKVFCTVSQSNQVLSPQNNPQQLRANVEEARVTKTLAVVMVGFAFCWLPICVMDYIDAARGERSLPREAYLSYGYLGYLSSTINPFIYGAMNRYFRQEYKAILKKLCRFESCWLSSSFYLQHSCGSTKGDFEESLTWFCSIGSLLRHRVQQSKRRQEPTVVVYNVKN